MQIQNERCGAALVVHVEGRLDSVTTPAFEAHCLQAVAQGERTLVLDFGTLKYVSSAGLRSILVISKALTAGGGECVLANARGLVREVFELSGFLRIFRVLDSLEAPVAQAPVAQD